MAVNATTMRCPVCDEETLQTLSTSFGAWERCSRCRGVFIHEDLIAAASADRTQCTAALAETKSLLLPTDRSCPKCLQNLFDGRVESRGVIFSLCPTCKSLWTTLPTLKQFEEAIEKKIATETEASGVGTADVSGAGFRPSKFYEDSGMARFFRVFARLFDNVADSFRTDPEEKELLKEAKRLKKQKGKKEPPATEQGGRAPEVWRSKPEKIIKQVEPTPPPPIKEVSKPVTPPEPVTPPAPATPPGQVAAGDQYGQSLHPKDVGAITPIEPEAESPKIEIPQFIFPEEPAVDEPVKVQTPAPKPIEKKPAPMTGEKKPGFLASLKAAWSPAPRKAASPKPAPAPKPAPMKVVEPPKPKPAPAPKPVKPAPVPKPKKEKPPKEPFDLLAFWPPWLLAIGGALASGLRDYGYEMEPFLLWGVMGWSVGMMVRLKRLYPSPVVLKGQIVPAREEDPKGPLVFKTDDKVYALNKLKRWDVIPRLFGLSNPRQLLKGDVTLTGWVREKLAPSIEVHEVRAEKVFRKSMAKALRWIFAVLVFVVALGVYLSLD